jgi:hypothetical protein
VTAAAGFARVGEDIGELPDFLADVCVEVAAVPRALVGATVEGVLWQAAPGRFLLRVPRAAAFLVDGGRRVTIDPEPRSEATVVNRFLRMTPLAALLYQRGSLAFHAAAAASSRGVILLAGDSAAGKSTLLMALLQRGWTMLADELATVNLDDCGRPQILPAVSAIELSRDAAERFGLADEYPGQRADNRQTLDMSRQFEFRPRPLRTIFWLAAHNEDRIEQRDVEGMECFRALGILTYNSHVADALLDRAAYMRQATIIAQTVAMHRVYRPRGRWVAEELADRIEAICA